MRALILADADAVARRAADRVAEEAARNRVLVLLLPTGKTAIPLYAALAARRAAGMLDLSRARAFNLDELALPEGHPGSFRAFMEEHAVGPLGLDRGRWEIPVATGDLDAECARYDAALDAAGGADLALLGLGADGHVAYNLPGPPVERTHVVAVPEAVADSLAVPVGERPLRAVTVGLGPLRAARRLVLLATTADKRAAVKALLDGPADDRWPVTHLRDHPSFDVLLSAEAAPKGAA